MSHRSNRSDRDRTKPSGQDLVYGVNAVLEALRAGKRQIETITILESARPDRLKSVLDLAREKRVPVHRVPRLDLDRSLGEARHQGVVARIAAARYTDADELLDQVDRCTPETLYERRWALLVIERVLAQLRKEWDAEGRASEFDVLKSSLLGEAPPGGYVALAERLTTSEGAVRVAVHRLRRKFQSRLKQEIADTVVSVDDVDDEIRYLIQALNA